MENSDSFTEHETIGALFRKLRLERSLDIADVSEETRIPKQTIRAMEADDYAELPAHAFARGFYTLYAKMLGLNPEDILQRYAEERSGSVQLKQQGNIQSPSWKHDNVGTMAERPSLTFGSIVGFVLLIIILTSAGISWYAGYNPATDISKWLRGLQKDPQTVTLPQTDAEATAPTAEEGKETIIEQKSSITEHPPEGTLAEQTVQYHLKAEFSDTTNITVTIDENDPVTMNLQQGSVHTWHAQKALVLEMDKGTGVKLQLNDITIPIPEPENGKIMVMIPEYLLNPNVDYSN